MKIKKSYIFFFFLFVIIILINSPYLEPILDYSLGVSWSKPIVVILKNNSKDLIIAFIIALYIDYVRSKESRFLIVNENQIKLSTEVSDIITTVSSSAIIRMLLKKIYRPFSSSENINSLIDLILPDKDIYTNVRVKYTLLDSDADDKKYILKYDIEFSSKLKEYIIALAPNAELQGRISNSCPKICDIITVPTLDQSYNQFEQLATNIKVNKITKDSRGDFVRTPIELKVLKSRKYYKTYLQDLTSDDCRKIILLSGKIQSNTEELCTILVNTPDLELNKNDHFIYWVSDRPMWVSQIEIDASRFSYGGNKKFKYQPLMVGYKKSQNISCENDIYKLLVHDWIGNGSGIIFSWRK